MKGAATFVMTMVICVLAASAHQYVSGVFFP